ncbi:MAG: hypothetical protein WKG07_44865 [Hymenobacter sp.]
MLTYFRSTSPTSQRQAVVSELTKLLSRPLRPIAEGALRLPRPPAGRSTRTTA